MAINRSREYTWRRPEYIQQRVRVVARASAKANKVKPSNIRTIEGLDFSSVVRFHIILVVVELLQD
jgi:hypothetical protein